MAKLSGMKCKVYIHDGINGKLLGGQRNATLSRSSETIDSTSKDSDGNWTESLPGFKSWSVDTDGAFIESDEAYKIIEQRFLDGEDVVVYIEMPSKNKYVGNCVITDASLEAPYDDLVSYSLSLQGSGALRTTTDDIGNMPIA